MKLAIVAGEASGDLHASEVVRELKQLGPALEMFGIGGDLLAREGMQLLHHASELGFIGIFNVLRHLPMFRGIYRELIERLEIEKQDAVLLVALLPGSRRQEINGLLHAMLDAVAILRRERKVNAYIIQAPTIDYDELLAIVKTKDIDVPILPHDRGEGVAAADVALSASGTATLESAVLGTPVVVMYRLSRATYLLGKAVVKLPNFSLVNIVAEIEVVPELMQSEVNGERIASEVRRIVAPENYERIRAELAKVREKLGEPGASRRVAEEIHKMVAG